MRAFGDFYRRLLVRYPQGIVVIRSIRPSMRMASPGARAESVRFLKDLGDQLLQVVTVVDSGGVLGLMLQSVLRGFNALVQPGRIVMAESDERLAELCARHIVSDLRRDDVSGRLIAAIVNVRARHTVHSLRSASGG